MRFFQRGFQRIKHVWGDGTIWTPNEMRHWLQHPLVQQRINAMITGGNTEDRFQYFLRTYLRGRLPVERALTLGCGAGELERGLSQYRFTRLHEGIDLADAAVRQAEHAAQHEQLTLRYRVADLNTVKLERRAYDVIFGVSSIHHVQNLENLFAEVQAALKPGGYFFLDEYIGPSQFQWTQTQLHLMNDYLDELPDHLKRSVSERGKFKDRVIRKSVEYQTAADPSEAVRSAEILPLLGRFFRIVEFKGYGGSLIHELLYDITGNFREENPGSLEALQKLFAAEDALIADGKLTHDFAVIVATV